MGSTQSTPEYFNTHTFDRIRAYNSIALSKSVEATNVATTAGSSQEVIDASLDVSRKILSTMFILSPSTIELSNSIDVSNLSVADLNGFATAYNQDCIDSAQAKESALYALARLHKLDHLLMHPANASD